MLRVILTSLLFFTAYFASAEGGRSVDWQAWPTVGSADFRWLFFDIYTSELKTPSGVLQKARPFDEQSLALTITYQRSVSSEEFVDATITQWRKLSVDPTFIDHWQGELGSIFPSVTRGDRLVFLAMNASSQLLRYDPQTEGWQLLFEFDREFRRHFLAIWLDEKSQYPDLRNQLIGVKK